VGGGKERAQRGRHEGEDTYSCFHTGGTSDARYGASRPALTARRIPGAPCKLSRAVSSGTARYVIQGRGCRIVYTRWWCLTGGRIVRPAWPAYAACCISMFPERAPLPRCATLGPAEYSPSGSLFLARLPRTRLPSTLLRVQPDRSLTAPSLGDTPMYSE